MEKFAVDLDKVLDDFELQEDQAELQTKGFQTSPVSPTNADLKEPAANPAQPDTEELARNLSSENGFHVEENGGLPLLDFNISAMGNAKEEPLVIFDNPVDSRLPAEDVSSSRSQYASEAVEELAFLGSVLHEGVVASQQQSTEELVELEPEGVQSGGTSPVVEFRDIGSGNHQGPAEEAPVIHSGPVEDVPIAEHRDVVVEKPPAAQETVAYGTTNVYSDDELEKYLKELEEEEQQLISPQEQEQKDVAAVYEQPIAVIPEPEQESELVEELETGHERGPEEEPEFEENMPQSESQQFAETHQESEELIEEDDDESEADEEASSEPIHASVVQRSDVVETGQTENGIAESEQVVDYQNEETFSPGATETPADVQVSEPSSDSFAAEEQQEHGIPEPYSSLTDEERVLGLLKPVWIADEDAPSCMNCTARFTVLRRRHHCRACGRVMCSACCSAKGRLEYLEGKEARICLGCLQILNKVEAYKKWANPGENSTAPPPSSGSSASPSSVGSTPASSPSAHTPSRRVNPNNPAEYCSTIPPPLQASASALPPPSIMVPVSVLKKEGSTSSGRTRSEPKQVMFSDGIRPGGDLTELDSWRSASHPENPQSPVKRIPKPVVVPASSSQLRPGPSGPKYLRISEVLPWIFIDERGIDTEEKLVEHLNLPGSPPVVFAVKTGLEHGVERHLKVLVKLLELSCCVKKKCWCFSTEGMRWVGQDEMLFLIEQESVQTDEGDVVEKLPPSDVFAHLKTIYEEASIRRNVVANMGHTLTPGTFLGSTDHGGFLFFRPSFQCLQLLPVPSAPFLVGILLQRWEIPWAKVFPLRLLLRLGAEFRYYPCPLFSVRQRKPVFGEIGHTVINLLADMRNFSYSLPAVPGLVVHMKERETSVLIPKSRYQSVCKALAQSNDHVISIAATFSPAADAHLVCLQLDDGSYQTQAINIHSRPRKVTGASFVVFNGALKSSSGLSGRSSIVEDGVMVQLLPDTLESLKQALNRMEDFVIQCGKASAQPPEESVTLSWVDHEPTLVNTGVRSPIDNKDLTGVSSVRVLQARDYKGEGNRLLRWTELFFIQAEESNQSHASDGNEVTRFAEAISKASCMALAGKMQTLDPQSLIALRVTLTSDMVEYQAGAGGKPLPDACIADLDSSLIPMLHRESAAQGTSCVIELWFRILYP